jgi:hypothetical protein
MHFSLQYMFETRYGVKEVVVFRIKLCLENHLTYEIFECLVVKSSLILTKVSSVN